MEKVLLYLDDLDDAFFALALVRERRWRSMLTLLAAAMVGLIGLATTYVAFHEPTLGAASLALLTVLLLYRAATQPGPVLAGKA